MHEALTLPITDPIAKFLLILVIILIVPLLLNKLRIPHLLGLIIAGAVVGPFGFHLMERDSSIILSGTAGLLYIMFLAGLEIDIEDFKKNSGKSLIFGLYTFMIPMTIGLLASIFIFKFSIQSSVLLASMLASHTLIAYPIISKYGLAKNQAVNITVGGTMITDTLALLVLAVIVGMQAGDVNGNFWFRLSASIIAFVLIIVIFFPIIGRWFFKRVNDSISQYIFVLTLLFLGAFLAELAGIEGIIGAFLAGLSLNRLIPSTSPLMNRVQFVGNAIFIPFFLIGVGMLINYKAFFSDFESIKVAIIMTLVAITSKFLAAWATQKTFKFSVDERRLIFGLSNAQAAATLAAVLVGYNIILNQPEIDAAALVGEVVEPIRLLNDSVLNGSIVMILITCTLASFQAQKGAKNIALSEAASNQHSASEQEKDDRILIPINRLEATENLIDLSITIMPKKSKSKLYTLNIIDNSTSADDDGPEKNAKRIIKRAAIAASATDHEIEPLIRYDINIVNGLMSVVKENKITDLILGLHVQKGFSQSFLGNLTNGILQKCNTTTMIYKHIQPLATIKRHLVIVPDKAEEELGFIQWLSRVYNIATNTCAKLIFYTTQDTIKHIRQAKGKNPIEFDFVEFNDWNDLYILSKDIRKDDNLVIVLSRKDKSSYNTVMAKIPNYLNKNFQQNSFILLFPIQDGIDMEPNIDFTNPSFFEAGRTTLLDKITSKVFRKK
jgi:Kef-type K+ transport system membrane component KefB